MMLDCYDFYRWSVGEIRLPYQWALDLLDRNQEHELGDESAQFEEDGEK